MTTEETAPRDVSAALTTVSHVVFERYRSLRDVKLELESLNVLIGANASGKSNALDGLRLLHEAVVERDFSEAVRARGGIVHLAWKGEEASYVRLTLRVTTPEGIYEWIVRLQRKAYDFFVEEEVREIRRGHPPTTLIESHEGQGWWWSDQGQKVELRQQPTACALSAAAADAAFPARDVVDFVRSWGFFDPSPMLLRRASFDLEPSHLDAYGRNLSSRLVALRNQGDGLFERILEATRSILGVPEKLELREGDDRIYFTQEEPGLKYPVHQVGASSGTLRILALMTALLGEPVSTLVGIEEPENYVHPAALKAFVEHLLRARDHAQILITTHSPLLLDYLDDPAAVCVVRNEPGSGTVITREDRPEAIRRALDESGFGLGEFYETRGFGG